MKPFILHTDCSALGTGVVLYQKQDDSSERVIAYASRSERPSKKYPTHKLGFVSSKWAITAKFNDYHCDNIFEVNRRV